MARLRRRARDSSGPARRAPRGMRGGVAGCIAVADTSVDRGPPCIAIVQPAGALTTDAAWLAADVMRRGRLRSGAPAPWTMHGEPVAALRSVRRSAACDEEKRRRTS